MRRRNFITLLGSAAAMWPIRARAQQAGMPVVGWLSTRAPGEGAYLLAAFRQGLKEAGYVEGQNVTLEFRWGEGHYERMPAYAAELVRRAVTAHSRSGESQENPATLFLSIANSPVNREHRSCPPRSSCKRDQ